MRKKKWNEWNGSVPEMPKRHKWALLNHDPLAKLTEEQKQQFRTGGFVGNKHANHTGDSPNRPEHILTDAELGVIGLRTRGDDTIVTLPQLKCPSDNSIKEIMAYAQLQRYKRLCWQLGGFLAAAVLFDIAFIIWLIRIAS